MASPVVQFPCPPSQCPIHLDNDVSAHGARLNAVEEGQKRVEGKLDGLFYMLLASLLAATLSFLGSAILLLVTLKPK